MDRFAMCNVGLKHISLVLSLLHYAVGQGPKCIPIVSEGNEETLKPYRNLIEFKGDNSCILCSSKEAQIFKPTICKRAACYNAQCVCCINTDTCPYQYNEEKEKFELNKMWVAKQCAKSSPIPDNGNRDEQSKNHIPLIIGFAVGGIMLAVVIAGVLLGRANRALSPGDSSVATTPVSMSYSEWISNYSMGGWGSKHVSTRVQESAGSLSDVEDSPGMSVYKIMYSEVDAMNSEKYKLNDGDATVIEIDESGAFENQNQLTFYHPHNDILSCIATPLHDDRNMMEVECWSNAESLPYESVIQLRKIDANGNDAESYLSKSWRSWRSHCDHDSLCWSATASIRRNSTTNDSAFSKRRDTWSDAESNGDKRSSIYRFSLPARRSFVGCDASSTQSGWIRVPKHLNINFANLKHVFVDVHRSMSYSYEDGRSSGFWAPSDGSGTITEFGDSDFEKTKSFITIKNNYICYENEIPGLHDELFLYSLQYNSHVRPRRCSI